MLETPKKTLMKIAKTATDRQIFAMPPRTVRRTLRGGWQEVCRYAMPVSSHAHARVVIEETRRACSLGCSRECTRAEFHRVETSPLLDEITRSHTTKFHQLDCDQT